MPDNPKEKPDEIESFLTSIRIGADDPKASDAIQDIKAKLYPELYPEVLSDDDVMEEFQKLTSKSPESLRDIKNKTLLTPEDLRRLDIAEKNVKREAQTLRRIAGPRRVRAGSFFISIYNSTFLGQDFEVSMDKKAAFDALLVSILAHKANAFDDYILAGETSIFEITQETINLEIKKFCKTFAMDYESILLKLQSHIQERQLTSKQAAIQDKLRKAPSRRLERELQSHETDTPLPEDPFIIVDGKKVMR